MNSAKERLIKIINEIPESELAKVLDFAEYIKDKEDKKIFKEITKASESSLDFWINDVDDKIWNDV
ncbi:hypothetical protein JOC78_002781 [Bacillus ectoiniformans]|uniref:DUF2281 domain-containing protein n=1 Tax=Bacillus ectoiniformans TaxID=1494429 RepID=UPI0019582808|nr:DUF2281 domain-containing protein [Bacillus ectoiniformans]MBM7649797.1 hypothetical protein [Bacillus ectoiniformans]